MIEYNKTPQSVYTGWGSYVVDMNEEMNTNIAYCSIPYNHETTSRRQGTAMACDNGLPNNKTTLDQRLVLLEVMKDAPRSLGPSVYYYIGTSYF